MDQHRGGEEVEMLHNITIRAVGNGYIVDVGCQTFVFQDATGMLIEIGKYLVDPEGTEKRYRSEQRNMKFTGNRPVEAAAAIGEDLRGGTQAIDAAGRNYRLA